jgi:hypothetical protein
MSGLYGFENVSNAKNFSIVSAGVLMLDEISRRAIKLGPAILISCL